ncbi:alpha/beta fold hydrolase [Leptospira sp. WS39.C2]
MDGKFNNSESMKQFGQFFDFQGHSIFYGTFGKGETLLLLHGYPFNSFDWNWVLEDLSKRYQVIFIDFLGMGFSDKPENHLYSFEEYVLILNSLLLKLNIKQVKILAHDLAVSIVQEMVSTNEKLNFEISSIAFMNGGLFTDVYNPRLIQRLLSQTPNIVGKFISKKISRKSVEKSLQQMFGPNTQPSQNLLEEYWSILNYNEGKQIAYLIGRLVFEKVKYQKRWIEALKNTKIPFCYIYGPNDPNSGTQMALRFKKEYPNAPIYNLSNDIGHWPQVESPKEVVTIFLNFQDKLIQK